MYLKIRHYLVSYLKYLKTMRLNWYNLNEIEFHSAGTHPLPTSRLDALASLTAGRYQKKADVPKQATFQ